MLKKGNNYNLILLIIASLLILFWVENYSPRLFRYLFLLLGINIIFAVSLNITNGWTNIFSLGVGGIVLAAAYPAAYLTLSPAFKRDMVNLQLPNFLLNYQYPFILALIVGGIVGSLIGIILCLPSLRVHGLYFAMLSLGLNYILIYVIRSTPDITNAARGLRQFPHYTNAWWVGGIAFLLIYIAFRLKNSNLGRAFIAIGKDQVLAEHMGINLIKYKLLSFGLSNFFIALGGILHIHLILNLYPRTYDINWVFVIVTMIVLGGLGSITGAIIGAFVITIFSEIIAPLEGGFVLFGLIEFPRMLGISTILLSLTVLLVLIFKPKGIMGEEEISWQYIKNIISK